jgi:hypothetical protein
MQTQLTGWHPIPDICTALNVAYEDVRLIVKQASENGEQWVKKDGARWLINTNHPAYYLQIVDEFSEDEELPDEADLEDLYPTQTVPDPVPTPPPSPDVVRNWPELRTWLDEQGVTIFFNALSAEDQTSWHWRWGEVSGERCRSVDDAILTAIKVRMAHLERCVAEKKIQDLPVQPCRRKWI